MTLVMCLVLIFAALLSLALSDPDNLDHLIDHFDKSHSKHHRKGRGVKDEETGSHHSRRHKHHTESAADRNKPKKGVDYFLHHESHLSVYDWNSFTPANQKAKADMKTMGTGKPVADLGLHQPVYVSMTTTSERIRYVSYSIIDVFKGSVIPTHVFLFVSNSGFLNDKGIQKEILPVALQEIAANYPLTIVFTKNIGPHRRLLPLLSKFWKTDCVIIALDDDRTSDFTKQAVEKLLLYYIHSGKSSIIALKVILLFIFLISILQNC